MTTNDAFERNLSIWLHEEAEHHVPDHLAEVLQRTATSRQRPAWSSLERWLPVDTTFRRSVFARPTPVRQLALLFLIGLLIVALVAFAVGSRRSTLAPYGLARNGDVVASRDGDIYAIDPATSAATLIIGGDTFDFVPTYSRDGSKFLFMRSDGPMPTSGPPMLSLMVANADGSGLRALTGPVRELSWFDWSPNGLQIAYIYNFGTLAVANVDGSGSTDLVTGQPTHFVTWLPPDGSEILFRGEPAKETDPGTGIYAIRPDGTGLRPVSTKPPNNDFDYMSLTVAPDGSKISFARFTSNATPSVVVLDLLTGEERVLPHPPGTSQRGGGVFSPDGTLVAYSRIYADGTYQLVVAPVDGSSDGTALGPLRSGDAEGSSYVFTPDGTAVVAGLGQDDRRDIWRLPIDGSPGSTVAEGGSFSFVDTQRLAP